MTGGASILPDVLWCKSLEYAGLCKIDGTILLDKKREGFVLKVWLDAEASKNNETGFHPSLFILVIGGKMKVIYIGLSEFLSYLFSKATLK